MAHWHRHIQEAKHARPGYTMPSRQWVEKYLLYYQGGSNTGGTSFTFQSARLGAGAVGQNYFWNYMVRGLGDGINQLDLVLANAGMNGKKAKLFGLSQPSPPTRATCAAP